MQGSVLVGEHSVRATLPVPPSQNRYWRLMKGRIVKLKEARDYRQKIEEVMVSAGVQPLTGPVRVHVRWYRARRAGDLDNRLKVLLDALQGLLYVDDKQIVEILAQRSEDKSNPRVYIHVEEAS